MDDAVKLLLAFVLGAVIGLERELNERKVQVPGKKPVAILGLRSFALMSTLGAFAGFLASDLAFFSILITVMFMLLLLTFYIFDTLNTKDTGITTELAGIFSYLLGFSIAVAVIPIQLVLATTVILILLLSRKEEIKSAVQDIRRQEVNAFIAYAIIALVILPFLPNTSYSLSDVRGLEEFFRNVGVNLGALTNLEIINPFRIWVIVALITGVDMLGYILERTIGQKKGWLVASAAGGFISSTATTQSLAQQSKETTQTNHLLAAAVLSNMVSFVQIAILIGAVNAAFLVRVFPTILILLLVSGGITVFFLFSRERTGRKQELKLKKSNIIDVFPALKFAGLFLVISIVSKIALELFGESGFLAATAFGSLAGLDAVMINTSQLAERTIDVRLGVMAFLLANGINLTAKAVYSYLQGSREFFIKFSISVGVITAASLLGLMFV